jgi:hypothetical protein
VVTDGTRTSGGHGSARSLPRVLDAWGRGRTTGPILNLLATSKIMKRDLPGETFLLSTFMAARLRPEQQSGDQDTRPTSGRRQ